jgi:hypothetical protein
VSYPAVGLDVDGVVADFFGHCVETLGLDAARWTDWDVTRTFGSEVDRAIGELCQDPATWVSVKPFADAGEAIATLVAKRSVPVFITALPKRFFLLRKWWLETHLGEALGGFPVWLYVASSKDKAALAQELQLTHFVEDRPDTAAAMAEAGLASILVPTSYTGTPPRGVRVQSLLDFAREVQ